MKPWTFRFELSRGRWWWTWPCRRILSKAGKVVPFTGKCLSQKFHSKQRRVLSNRPVLKALYLPCRWALLYCRCNILYSYTRAQLFHVLLNFHLQPHYFCSDSNIHFLEMLCTLYPIRLKYWFFWNHLTDGLEGASRYLRESFGASNRRRKGCCHVHSRGEFLADENNIFTFFWLFSYSN